MVTFDLNALWNDLIAENDRAARVHRLTRPDLYPVVETPQNPVTAADKVPGGDDLDEVVDETAAGPVSQREEE